MMTHVDLGLPLGFRFRPLEEEELVDYYLKNKVCGEEMIPGILKEVDIYEKNPWEIFDKNSSEGFYVFNSQKDKSKAKVGRRAGCGTWTNRNRKEFTYNGYRWCRRDFSFQVKKSNSNSADVHAYHQEDNNGHWVMTEYSLLPSPGLTLLHDFVLCKITNKSANKEQGDEEEREEHEDRSSNKTDSEASIPYQESHGGNQNDDISADGNSYQAILPKVKDRGHCYHATVTNQTQNHQHGDLADNGIGSQAIVANQIQNHQHECLAGNGICSQAMVTNRVENHQHEGPVGNGIGYQATVTQQIENPQHGDLVGNGIWYQATVSPQLENKDDNEFQTLAKRSLSTKGEEEEHPSKKMRVASSSPYNNQAGNGLQILPPTNILSRSILQLGSFFSSMDTETSAALHAELDRLLDPSLPASSMLLPTTISAHKTSLLPTATTSANPSNLSLTFFKRIT